LFDTCLPDLKHNLFVALDVVR